MRSAFSCLLRPFCIALPGMAAVSLAVAAPGDLIGGFGTDGKVLVAESGRSLSAQSLAVQSDGRLVTAGASASEGSLDAEGFLVARFLPNGAADPSFNSTGRRVFAVNGTGSARSVMLQPDGKILCGGTVYSGVNTAFAVVRFLADGTLDTSFNGTGFAITQVSPWLDGIHAMALQPDGKIVVAGTASDNSGTNDDMVVARYTSAGVLDTGFNGNGIHIVNTGTGPALASAVLLQPDGRIVVAGSQISGLANDFAVIRLNADGTLDAGFGNGGKVVPATAADDGGRALAAGPGGTLLVGGYAFSSSGAEFAALRLLPDGRPDASFGQQGRTVAGFGPGSQDLCLSMTVQDNGRVLLSGYVQQAGGSEFGLLRLEPAGQVDASFGTSGWRTIAMGGGFAQAAAVALLTDGSVVAAGFRDEFFTSSIALAKLEGDPAPWAALQFPPAEPLAGVNAEMSFGAAHAAVTAQQSFLLLNQGAGPLSGISVSVTGAASGDFTLIQSPPAVIQARSAAPVTVKFSPSLGAGQRQAVLRIESNDQDRSLITVSMAGTAATPLQAWRYRHFGSVLDAGTGAGEVDADGDGSSNLLEFFAGTDPRQGGISPGTLEMNAGTLFYTMPRSGAAVAEGLTAFIETSPFTWTDWTALIAGSPQISGAGDVQLLRFACGPPQPGRRFFRLRIVRAP